MAYQDGVYHIPSAGLALLGAVLIQIGTNLANDYFDFKRGADAHRIGPIRVTQAGLVSPRVMLSVILIVFLAAAAVAYPLIERGGIPITIIAVMSVLSGLLYTAGPLPLAYLGLGEIFVLIFFGPVAVGGTYYVQSLEINLAVLLAGVAPGLFSVAILTVNNLRDIDGDRQVGKKTLAVRLGKNFAMAEYFWAITAGCLVPVIIHFVTDDYERSMIAVATLFFSFPAIKTVFTDTSGPALNQTLGYTGQLLVIYTLLFSIGWVL